MSEICATVLRKFRAADHFSIMSIDDLPIRHVSHELADQAVDELRNAIRREPYFVFQTADKNDYGTDVQLEVQIARGMTNFRVHVQVKGTETQPNSDGSVSVNGICCTNLSYLLGQPDSIYVCFHAPSGRLLSRYARDVLKEYESNRSDWKSQKTITVRFFEEFSKSFQQSLHARVLARSQHDKNSRMQWACVRPELLSKLVHHDVPNIDIPESVAEAAEYLKALYLDGHDEVICQAFDRFAARFEGDDDLMSMLYMAEINLAMKHQPFNDARVKDSIRLLLRMKAKTPDRLDIAYTLANAHLAIGANQEAKMLYRSVIAQANGHVKMLAWCWKNLGSVLEVEGNIREAKACFERALEVNPDLGEAQFALAQWHIKNASTLQESLRYLDEIVRQRGSAVEMCGVQGWRAELLFKAGESDAAFRDIFALTEVAEKHEWIWNWCAALVSKYGHASSPATRKAVRFWKVYKAYHPDHYLAESELLLSFAQLKILENEEQIDFDAFRERVNKIARKKDNELAPLLFDRLGHWSQADEDWVEAEKAFRHAFELAPNKYGICLGTALNNLRQFEEALPILLKQAEQHNPDAKSWFQVAIAQEGVGNIEKCIAAYGEAIRLDEDYDVAWFNLGGIHFNQQDLKSAVEVWKEALKRFPEHRLAKKLLRELPFLFRS